MIHPAAAPGLIIAAPRSGAGKTTVTLGLLRALRRRDHRVQPFKCGPDYIDPAFHEVAAGRASYNLDSWAMGAGLIATLAATTSMDADIAIAEGVMGLFDGAAARGQSGSGTTADLAALLGWPVVLVLDVTGQTETAAAVALGCAGYRDDVAIAGVILNRVASARHLALIAPAFERIKLPLFGAILRDEGIALPERHLGLVQAREIENIDQHLDRLADAIDAVIDVDAIRRAARPAKVLPAASDARSNASKLPPPGQRIALAQDRAFSFMYPHLLRQWCSAGAEIIPFSPLADEAPDATADAVWLPGGYPELHAGTLAAAYHFHKGLRALAVRSVPIHGECGGYMVLGRGLEDADGVRHEMAGLLGLETSFAKRKLHLGYRRARLQRDCSLGAAGNEVFGHEYHYASIVSVDGEALVDCRDASGANVPEQGMRRGSTTGTFFHVIDGAAA
ncbi:cobyrinate a,c-diamide synthase [Bradyrhizobium sp. dw_411]|uniref:cobyrinate a,c-diamide synthase n=1 Tax=Bradyrhizobium sp. dw_411 TaxID=2720082 RepID=UPI001BD06360|nr:cobyrinate a,c-diamide synthase [Bradyrhizobium sp. dw_411]